MKLKSDVLELIQLYNAQYAGAYAGDPETTYDKILQLCSRTIEIIADDEEQAEQFAFEEFKRLWNAQPDKNFDLFELDIWEKKLCKSIEK